VAYTTDDLDVWREVMARAMTAAGARPGDLLHLAYGYGLFTGGLGFHQGAERIGMTVVPASSGNTARQCLLLRDLQPVGLGATPSFAVHIAEMLAEQGVSPGELALRYGMFGAEPWSEGIRRAIEQGLGCRAYDVYGLSEIIGPGVAAECERREGLHVADDHFLPEVIDPASGAVLEPGRQGELVLTTLTKRGMPLIRYRTGDITALTLEPCACGRTSARMARLVGRSDDMLIIKGVNLYPSEVEGALLGVEELVPQYQLVVDRTATLARLEIQVEPSLAFLAVSGSTDVAHPAVAALIERIAGRLRAALGLGVDVTLMPPRTLPRSEGKAIRVVERT
jgi:phenylacetate-CoA ligase